MSELRREVLEPHQGGLVALASARSTAVALRSLALLEPAAIGLVESARALALRAR